MPTTKPNVACFAIGGGWMFMCAPCAATADETPDDWTGLDNPYVANEMCECCRKPLQEVCGGK